MSVYAVVIGLLARLATLLLATGVGQNIPGATNVSVTLSTGIPSMAQEITSTHVSFSIEQDQWLDWTGINSPNQLTFNVLNNLKKITGIPPKIQVGANSADRMIWFPNVEIIKVKFPHLMLYTPYPEATRITVSDNYYQLLKWLPSGTMIWGINLGQDNATNAVNMAKRNEADLYKKSWTQAQYSAVGKKLLGLSLHNAIGLKQGAAISIQGYSFASQSFTPTGVINNGLLASAPCKTITCSNLISQHCYSGKFCQGGAFALSSFMSKSAIRSNLTVFHANIAEVHSKGLAYILGETNSIACRSVPGVSGTAGATLWVIDYTLQAAIQGIKDTFFHQGIRYKYNFFQPVSLNCSIVDTSARSSPQAPHIMPTYYAAILVARAIGNTGNAQVIELFISKSNVLGYTIYESGKLVCTQYSYETVDVTVSGTERSETINFADGFNLRSTEALLLSFDD
ncbi:glycoside hydrolase family 79 protein [Sphaerobolus stellatus SS14]|nr:glycoside hydrolase family 79 protein [Sphaerobolus stellatus SS14]